MTHLYKWRNQFADVFISKISDGTISYEVRDKDSGKLMEPLRTVKYIVDEINKQIIIDHRAMPLNEFVFAASLLNDSSV